MRREWDTMDDDDPCTVYGLTVNDGFGSSRLFIGPSKVRSAVGANRRAAVGQRWRTRTPPTTVRTFTRTPGEGHAAAAASDDIDAPQRPHPVPYYCCDTRRSWCSVIILSSCSSSRLSYNSKSAKRSSCS